MSDLGIVDLVITTLTALALAAAFGVLLFAAPRRRENQFLAIHLGLLAVNVGAWAVILRSPGVTFERTALQVLDGSALAVPFTFALFVPQIVPQFADLPFLRPFRSRAAMLVLLGVTFALFFGALVWPGAFSANAVTGTGIDWNPIGLLRIAGRPLFIATCVGSGVTSVLVLKRMPEGAASRERARAYVVAFVVESATLAATAIGAVIPALRLRGIAYDLVLDAGLLAYVSLLVGGVLKFQLLDFDSRIKRTLAGVGVATVISIAWTVFSPFVTEQLSQFFGAAMAGCIAAAIGLGIAPLRRGKAEKSTESGSNRPSDIYRAEVEFVAELSGELEPRARILLERRRRELGVDVKLAARIEAEVVETLSGNRRTKLVPAPRT